MLGRLTRFGTTLASQTTESDAISISSPRHSSLPRPAVELMSIDTSGSGSSVGKDKG